MPSFFKPFCPAIPVPVPGTENIRIFEILDKIQDMRGYVVICSMSVPLCAT